MKYGVRWEAKRHTALAGASAHSWHTFTPSGTRRGMMLELPSKTPEACKHGATATWLEHPAPDRARSVPLRKANGGVQAWRHRNVAGASCSRPCPERPAPQGQRRRASMAVPQRGWSILLQTVPGASRSARPTEACKHQNSANHLVWVEWPSKFDALNGRDGRPRPSHLSAGWRCE
jgi:hypothetical protein